MKQSQKDIQKEIEDYIYQRLTQYHREIKRQTSTNLPVTSFSVTYLKEHCPKALTSYLQHTALEALLYSFRSSECEMNSLILVYNQWLKSNSGDGITLNKDLFSNYYIFFSDKTLTDISALINKIESKYESSEAHDDFILIDAKPTSQYWWYR